MKNYILRIEFLAVRRLRLPLHNHRWTHTDTHARKKRRKNKRRNDAEIRISFNLFSIAIIIYQNHTNYESYFRGGSKLAHIASIQACKEALWLCLLQLLLLRIIIGTNEWIEKWWWFDWCTCAWWRHFLLSSLTFSFDVPKWWIRNMPFVRSIYSHRCIPNEHRNTDHHVIWFGHVHRFCKWDMPQLQFCHKMFTKTEIPLFKSTNHSAMGLCVLVR